MVDTLGFFITAPNRHWVTNLSVATFFAVVPANAYLLLNPKNQLVDKFPRRELNINLK